MTTTKGPSRRADAGAAAILLLLDALLVGWLLFRIGMAGWADSMSGGSEASAPAVAQRTMWFLLAAAAVTGGGLFALRCRIAGTVQLLALGGAAVLCALSAVPADTAAR